MTCTDIPTGHLNELAIVLQVNEDDKRPPFVAGIEDVDVEEAMCLRECTLTHKPYPFLNFQSDGRYAFPATMTKDQIKRQIFHGGRLTCRLVNVQYMQGRSTKSYSGIVRHLYAHEAEKLQHSNVPSQTSLSRNGSNTVEVDDTDDCVIISKSTFAGKYPIGAEPDVEIFDKEPPRPISRHTMVKDRLTFGDAFCGAGGASQGALQAGYNVCWGIDKDDHAIEAYRLNHPGAYSLAMDAHDFPPENISKNAWRVDVLHLSPPCCYFSPAHTTDGPNDQSNYDATFTVGPILRKIKPRVATLEQTLGIVTNKQHHKTFLTLLCEIGHAGYDLRYKRWVFSELGLAQNRKRLVVIAARRGTPLPPFPNPTHGPCGSGLKPVVSIAQALYPMQRFGLRVHDPYHKLRPFHVPKPAYSPDSPLKSCITTSGTPDPHPSGTRNFTTRELSLLQSFPYTYQFVRSNTQAKVKIGNAFPPVVAEAVFRTIANTLKAVDRGIVGVQDNLDELQLELGFDDDNDSAPAGTRGPRRRGPRDEDEVIDLVGADEVIELPSDEDELA
ncbi:hypothetical protein ACJQWK_11648 [Exserohilum turcicum]